MTDSGGAPPRPTPNSRHNAFDWASEHDQGTNIIQVVTALLKRWKLLVGLPFGLAFVVAIISLILPSSYQATTSFVPEKSSAGVRLPGGIAGIATQFGIDVPGSTGTSSPQFYADLLRSRTLLDQMLQTRFPDPRRNATSDTAQLLEILEVYARTETRRLEKGRKRLNEAMSVTFDRQTGVVSLTVETQHPALTADISNLFVQLLNRFNLESRQSNARALREFVQGRVAESETELGEAEEALQRFHEQNRRFDQSPELQFRADQLQRQVRIREEIFITLRREYEEARIQEVNDTPLITVIDRAVTPDKRSHPKRRMNVFVAFFSGTVIALLLTFAQDYTRRARERDADDLDDLSDQWARLKSEIRSIARSRRADSSA